MKVTLRTHEDDSAFGALDTDLDAYCAQVWSDWSDAALPACVGSQLIERARKDSHGLIMTAHGEVDGRTQRLGYCVVVPSSDPLTGVVLPFLAAVFVEPAYRHRGLARSMVQEASRQLRERGHPNLASRVGHNDDALISMGERWGFVRLAEWMVLEP